MSFCERIKTLIYVLYCDGRWWNVNNVWINFIFCNSACFTSQTLIYRNLWRDDKSINTQHAVNGGNYSRAWNSGSVHGYFPLNHVTESCHWWHHGDGNHPLHIRPGHIDKHRNLLVTKSKYRITKWLSYTKRPNVQQVRKKEKSKN